MWMVHLKVHNGKNNNKKNLHKSVDLQSHSSFIGTDQFLNVNKEGIIRMVQEAARETLPKDCKVLTTGD